MLFKNIHLYFLIMKYIFIETSLNVMYITPDNHHKFEKINLYIEKKKLREFDENIDSDDEFYEDTLTTFYHNQIESYNREIILFENGDFILDKHSHKYGKIILETFGENNTIIKILKVKNVKY